MAYREEYEPKRKRAHSAYGHKLSRWVLCTQAAYTQVLNSQRLGGHHSGHHSGDHSGHHEVTIYRCLKDWPTRLGSDSYPAVLGPIAIPIRPPSHLSRPGVGEIGVYESSGNLDCKTRRSMGDMRRPEISAFAPPGRPSMDELALHVMVMRANNGESDPAYPYAPDSENSEGRQSPSAKAVALAPSVGPPHLPSVGLDVSGRRASWSGKLRLHGSGRHESWSGSYDYLISPELPFPPALNPGERSAQHFVQASSQSAGCLHKKSFLLPLWDKGA
eukprot:gene5781-6003_t